MNCSAIPHAICAISSVIRGSSRPCRRADVTPGPNLLHLVLLVCALPCARYTLSEMRHRPLPRGRLAAPALLAMACALVFLLFHLGSQRPPWIFIAALAGGLAIGALRGFTLQLQVDHMFDKPAAGARLVPGRPRPGRCRAARDRRLFCRGGRPALSHDRARDRGGLRRHANRAGDGHCDALAGSAACRPSSPVGAPS